MINPMFRLELLAEQQEELERKERQRTASSSSSNEPVIKSVPLMSFEAKMVSTDSTNWYRLEIEPSTICFLEICIGPKRMGRLGIRLYTDHNPKTCENFRRLCCGDGGRLQPGSRKPFHYKGTVFHQMQHNRFLVGGDISGGQPLPPSQEELDKIEFAKTRGRGKKKKPDPEADPPTDKSATEATESVSRSPQDEKSGNQKVDDDQILVPPPPPVELFIGGQSVFGGYFADESFAYRHTRRGLLSMVHTTGNPGSNGSQFRILLGPVADLDNVNVVFGEICYGLSLLDAFNSLMTGSGGRKCRFEGGSGGVCAGRPRELISIIESGEMEIPTHSEWLSQREDAARLLALHKLQSYIEPSGLGWKDVGNALEQGLKKSLGKKERRKKRRKI